MGSTERNNTMNKQFKWAWTLSILLFSGCDGGDDAIDTDTGDYGDAPPLGPTDDDIEGALAELDQLYPIDGLVFRGLECGANGPDLECIKNEIAGPHEPTYTPGDPLLKPTQAATTFLNSTMNPMFYTDIGGSPAIVLIFKPDVIDPIESCAYIQDASLNGCQLEPCQSYSGKFKMYNDAATSEICAERNPNPKSTYLCQIKASGLRSHLHTAYNNFINDYHTAVNKSDPQDPNGAYHKTQSGCILMKENQVSSFWSKETALDEGNLIAIGFIYTQGTEQKYSDLLASATNIQKLLIEAYPQETAMKIPIVEVTRTFKESSANNVTKIMNNSKIYYGIFEPLTFGKPTSPTPPCVTCTQTCIDGSNVSCTKDEDCTDYLRNTLGCTSPGDYQSYCRLDRDTCHFGTKK
jgi:hypothetical protein